MADHDVTSALVLYGSETGNASDFAQEICGLTERLHFPTHVSHLDDVEPILLSKYTVAIIIISTTGQGDLPLNARRFWKGLLRRKLPHTFLRDVQFTTFGLGDSSYPKFNWAARKLHKRLIQLGADELYPRGEADEQHEEGLDASFVPWSADLRRQLLETFPLRNGIKPTPDETLLEPKWILKVVEDPKPLLNGSKFERYTEQVNEGYISTMETSLAKSPNGNVHLSTNRRFKVTLDENTRMTPDSHWQDVRHLVFSASTSHRYEPGDVLAIYPENATEDVEEMLKAMGWTNMADKPICLLPTSSISNTDRATLPSIPPICLTSNTTLRDLLARHLDLNAIPKRSFFSLVAHFAQDQTQKERLLEFTKPEYIDELHDYTTRPRRSILEVLQEFDSVKIPWEWAANVLPELRGRQFSIASGGQLKQDSDGNTRFELLVAIVKYKTVIKKMRQGLCTRYLAGLPKNSLLDVTLQKGSLGITQTQAKRPVIMVGPGTGIAPIRSLIWERLDRREASASQRNGDSAAWNGDSSGKMVLFFGCRNKEADHFYRNELVELQQRLPLQVFTAFSRDQKQKIYVQDLIREQSQLVYRLLHDDGGIIYVCGSSGKMPQAVRVALTEAFTKSSTMHQGDAEAYLQTMEKDGRYKQETW